MKNFNLSGLTRHSIHSELYDYTNLESVNSLKITDGSKLKTGQEEFIKLCNDIKECGFIQPILINIKGEILSGYKRWLAAKLLGLTEVPTKTNVDEKYSELEIIIKSNNPINNRVLTYVEIWKSIHELQKEYKMPRGRKVKGYKGFKGSTDERIALILGLPETTINKIKIISRVSETNLETIDNEKISFNLMYLKCRSILEKRGELKKVKNKKEEIVIQDGEDLNNDIQYNSCATCCPGCSFFNPYGSCLRKLDEKYKDLKEPTNYDQYINLDPTKSN